MPEDLRTRLTDLISLEASLLDRREFKQWLTLYTQDALYWVPGWSDDPDAGIAIIYDHRARMEERVFRLVDTSAYAQMPASRTIHLLGPVSNITSTDGVHAADYSMSIAEIRPGDDLQVGLAEQHVFYAHCHIETVDDGDGGLLLQQKVIRLLDREQPIYNLTFIL